jgi:PIN domain nuclease of toxin-antitoxin system
LALLHNETGADKVEEAIFNKATISTVNWTEVIQKAIANNINIENLDNELAEIGLSYVAFDKQQAHIAGSLWQQLDVNISIKLINEKSQLFRLMKFLLQSISSC